MTPATYRFLDAIADSFNPLLAIVALVCPFLRKPRALRSTIAYYLSAGASIGVVYLVRAIDNSHQIWASFGLDYSTHSAFAASLVVSMGAFRRRWIVPLVIATVLYFSLELVMRYHGLLDILSSVAVAVMAALSIHLAIARLPMTSTDHVIAALASHGLLLTQDKVVPSVVGILTGESPATSWWTHPKARLIFSVLSELRDHPDVLLTKLLFRKDTFVHRSMWPALLAVASSRDTWQLRGLSRSAKDLLDRIDRGEGPVHASGAAVDELVVRLLAVANEIHTESGRHEMVLVAWQTWSNSVHCVPLRSVPDARTVIEQATMALGASRKALPWPSSPGAHRARA